MERTTAHIRAVIARAQLRQAAGLLIDCCQACSDEYRDEAIQLSERLYWLENEQGISGTISFSDVLLERNRIVNGMLLLLRKLDMLAGEEIPNSSVFS